MKGFKIMKKNNGFTLIELMVVVAIIGVLGAVAYPSYTSYMKKSARADAKVGLVKLADKQERFYLQNNKYTLDITSAAGLNTGVTGDTSEEGYYDFTVTSGDLVNEFLLTATAVTTKSQAGDTGCTVMTLSSTGAKEPNGNPTTEKDCW